MRNRGFQILDEQKCKFLCRRIVSAITFVIVFIYVLKKDAKYFDVSCTCTLSGATHSSSHLYKIVCCRLSSIKSLAAMAYNKWIHAVALMVNLETDNDCHYTHTSRGSFTGIQTYRLILLK